MTEQDRGEQGVQGESGGEGEQGEQGVQGIQGFQGVRGTKGERGGERGERGKEGKRGERGRTSSFDKSIIGLFLVVFIIGAVAVYAALTAVDQSNEVAKQTRKIEELSKYNAQQAISRRNDNCTLFERQELTAIRQVLGTYAYLDSLPKSEYGTNLTNAIVRNLPVTYAQAQAVHAPKYCNESPGEQGIGLPERGPDLPKLRDFKALTKPQ